MQVLELNSVNYFVQQFLWLCKVCLYTSELLFVSDVKTLFLFLATADAQVFLASVWLWIYVAVLTVKASAVVHEVSYWRITHVALKLFKLWFASRFPVLMRVWVIVFFIWWRLVMVLSWSLISVGMLYRVWRITYSEQPAIWCAAQSWHVYLLSILSHSRGSAFFVWLGLECHLSVMSMCHYKVSYLSL